MILECPECSTRYLVPDSAIGPEGRTVRCAKCRHSWFQPPVSIASPAGEAIEPDRAAPAGPVADPSPPFVDPVAPRLRRRSPTRRWTIAAVAAGLLMLVATAAILLSGAPGLAARLGLPIGAAETQLTIRANRPERRELENGSELFAVSGQVVNASDSRQRVPDIRAELRDASCRLVFSWTITPQKRTVGPGGTIDFNSANLNVPPSSRQLDLSFAGDGDAPQQKTDCRKA